MKQPPSTELASGAARRARNAGIRQSDIARAIRGALQAGMEVREVIATRDGIRILSGSPDSSGSMSGNTWDDVLDND